MIIGTEQGTTFPTKIGTSICKALIDTGATIMPRDICLALRIQGDQAQWRITPTDVARNERHQKRTGGATYNF